MCPEKNTNVSSFHTFLNSELISEASVLLDRVVSFPRDGSAFTPVWFSSGERSRARNELAADIIPRIISAARLTRSALRFPVAGHSGVSRSIERPIDREACDDDGLRKRKRNRRKSSGLIEKEGKKPIAEGLDWNGKGRGRCSSRLHPWIVNREVDEWEGMIYILAAYRNIRIFSLYVYVCVLRKIILIARFHWWILEKV